MFNIGDRVINSGKTSAGIQFGTVVGIIKAEIYFFMFIGEINYYLDPQSQAADAIRKYNDLFPGWENKLMYFVHLDVASATVAHLGLPKFSLMAFVEDDLKEFSIESTCIIP
jgi:hypothetical protein